MINIDSLTVGADPEFFIKDHMGRILPAVRFTSGNKESPENIGNDILIHQDNVTLEVNFKPQKTRQDFIEGVQLAMDALRKRIAPNELVITPSMEFTDYELKMFGDTAFEFRCDPEENIFGPSKYRMEHLLRSAGGHVHIGWGEADHREQNQIASWCDLMIGVPGVLLEDHIWAAKRRHNYGKPGSMRRKPYGLEYRTPGNEWLKTSESIGMMFDLVSNCFETSLVKGMRSPLDNTNSVKKVQRCINLSDSKAALGLLKQYEGYVKCM